MADRLCCLKGKVIRDQLITGLLSSYQLNENHFYDDKEGFFLVKNKKVYRFFPYPNVFKVFGYEK